MENHSSGNAIDQIDEVNLPDDIRQLLKESSAASKNADDIVKEYEEVFEDAKVIIDEAESTGRIQELETFIARCQTSGQETDNRMKKTEIHIKQIRVKLKAQDEQARQIHATNMITPKCPSNWFTICSGFRWKLTGIVILILIIMIVSIWILSIF